jgi:hypothetical protein
MRRIAAMAWRRGIHLRPWEAELARARASVGLGEAVARVRGASGCGGEDGHMHGGAGVGTWRHERVPARRRLEQRLRLEFEP